MAQIPLGPGTRVQTEVAQNRVIAPDTRAQDRANQQIAGTLQNVGFGIIDQRNREDQALARVKASNSLIDRESQIKTIATDLDEQIRVGKLSYDKAPEAYNAAVAKLDPIDTPGLDAAQQGEIGNSLKRIQLGGLANIEASAAKGRILSAQSDLSSRMDMLGKDAAMPGADVELINKRMDAEDVDTAGHLAFGEAWASKKQQFKDNNWTTHATQRVIESRESINSLKKLEHDLTAEDGFYARKLDPDKRNQLLNTVTGRIFQVEQHQQQQSMMREMKGERALAQMDKQASLGVPPTPADQQRWRTALHGTSMQGEYDTRIQQMNKSQQLLLLPDAQQEQYLTQLKASMQQNGASAADVENLNRLESARTERKKLRDSDPVTYSAITSGAQIEPINMAGIATPEGQQQLLAQLGERFLLAGSVRRKDGPTVMPSPWTEAERGMIQAAAKSIDDKTKIQIFGVIGAATQDKAEYSAAIQPFVGDDKLADTAGRAAFQGYKLPDGSSLAQTIMEGRKILGDKSKPMPGDDLLLAGFDKDVGFSMPAGSDQRDRAFQAYRASYAALSERKATKFNGVTLDSEISKQAIQAATGGITTWAGSKVIKPYGMADQDFSKSVGAQIDAMAERTKLPTDLLKGMPLMAAPRVPGFYYLMNGSEVQRDPQTGQELMVKP
ncbi:hypothetical protein HX823_09420 [Pseudomonas sp. P7759]|uniref:hypothetical protein n=1 Tax=Pseudomonas sp. P7759 TaxID=2738831 RepID=UPI00159F9ECD|nr:hypothetical protein [Pseudomonas sp. P7759]NWC74296.1 hypothetical protein [Pseudomonas sp. P7759]